MITPRVLMLGWEFPPVLHGGLGVACFGLARALAKQVALEVMVPWAVDEVSPDGLRVHGMDPGPPHATHENTARRYESFAPLARIPVRLDPYANIERADPRCDDPQPAAEDGRRPPEPYGVDLADKVAAFTEAVVTWAEGREFDLIHSHDWMTFAAGRALQRRTGKPLVVHVHSLQYDRAGPKVRDRVWEVERQGMAAAARVIPVSGYTARICVEHYGIDPRRVRPVHNGVEPVRSFRGVKRFPEKLVLFLGRLTDQKGPESFPEIAERVLARRRDVRFVMAGDGEQWRSLVESGAIRGLGGRIHFTGFLERDQVAELLSISDVYCMPSRSEPFGLSALEAAQFGVPAVVSRQSGVAEVLHSALQADCRDPAAMADHIVRLLGDDALRARSAEAARSEARAATWERSAGNVLEVYRELIPFS